MKLLNNTQSGRSMVEMLGVLAIIGVLSVGGIAGYSKAMFKHKLNSTLDMISQTIANIIELRNKNLGNYLEDTKDMVNIGIMPYCDINSITPNGTCPLPLGEIMGGFYSMEPITLMNISIFFTQNPQESCIGFFTSEIYKNIPNSWWYSNSENENGGYIAVVNNDGNAKVVYAKEDKVLEQGGEGGSEYYQGVKSVLTASDIANGCSICNGKEYCEIELRMVD